MTSGSRIRLLSGRAVLPHSLQPRTACDGPDTASPFSAAKGQVLGQFIAYLACAGQEPMATLGYSPLPPNLVQQDFAAIGPITGGVEPPPPTDANCPNPTVTGVLPLPSG